MNGAEFKTLREACGLTVPDMARLAISPRTGAPVGERTIRYWESGDVPVPDDVADLLLELDGSISQAVAGAMAQVRAVIKKQGRGPTETHMVRYRENEDLWRYQPEMKGLPATYHAAMINRARVALSRIGIATRIVWMNPSEYTRWLAGRDDSAGLRAVWAAEQGGKNE